MTATFCKYIVRYKFYIGIAVLFLLIVYGVDTMFAATTPIISIKDGHEFSGNTVNVTGQATVDCRCEIEATLNGKSLALQADGEFDVSIPVVATDDTVKIELKITAKPLHIFSTVKNTTATRTYNRQPMTIEVVDAPADWNAAKLTLTLRGSPNATVTVAEAPSIKSTLDANGDGSVRVPFSTAYNAKSNTYTIVATADGYAEGKKQVSVNNQKYDSARVDKEETTKKLKEMAQKAKDQMETFSGDGNVRLAVGSKNILERNCIGYSCAGDGWKYVVFTAAVKNAGDHPIYVNPNDFTLQDISGLTFTYDSETFYYDRPFDGVTLQPGGMTAGVLVFMVPSSSKVFTMLYVGRGGSVKKIVGIY